MGVQEQAFLDGEARAWLDRNRDKLGNADFAASDPVLKALRVAKIRPRHTIEVGCANGWRLRSLKAEYSCSAIGIEPFDLPAADDANNTVSGVVVVRGAAKKYGHRLNRKDTIIFGFCLYLIDREDLFDVAKEADSHLEDGGYIVIYDFHHEGPPVRVPYKHKEGLYSYKMDYAGLWLGDPAYTLYHKSVYPMDDGDYSSVTILKKNMAVWSRE